MSVNMLEIIVFIVCMNFMTKSSVADRVVITNNGPVQGVLVKTGKRNIEAFLGMPYAEPPTGRLRFQKPVPKTAWRGVYDASSLPPPCSQYGTSEYYYNPNLDNMSEDCLYLNMWVPYTKQSTHLKPVLIFLHGGSFNVGSSNLKVFDGTTLADRGDIIVVTLNYRVGVLGFFTSLSEDAIGNFGLYDQVLAIKWIKDNVKSFGGDPSQLVLMGNSAGAMAIAGHIVSPLTRNLFKRVILQSGGGFLPMILDENKRLLEISQKLANLVGCADKKMTVKEYPRIVVKCLKRLSDKELVAAEGVIMSGIALSFFPRVGDDYLPRPVIKMYNDGQFQDMDMLVGVNKDEGNIFLTAGEPNYFGKYGINNVQTISKRLASQFIRIAFKAVDQPKEKEIADNYSNRVENGTSDDYTRAIGQSVGDYFITCSTYFHAEMHSLRNPVYFYMFSHRPASTPLADWLGTTHFDEVQYIFGNPLFDNFTESEQKVSHRMMDRWIAFVKKGNPNIPNEKEWPKYTINSTVYLKIDMEESIGLRPDSYRCEFWRDRFQAGINDVLVAKLQRSGSKTVVEVFPLMITMSLLFYYVLQRINRN